MARKKITTLKKSRISAKTIGEITLEDKICYYITKKWNSVPIIENVSIEQYHGKDNLTYEVYNCSVRFNFKVGIKNVYPYQIRINKSIIDKYLLLTRIDKIKSLYESD